MSVNESSSALGGASPEPGSTPIPSPPSAAHATAGTASATRVKYEMAHDVLARQVFRTASSEAQARRKVEKFIRDERSRWDEQRGQRLTRLTQEDFDYIRPYLDEVNIEEADRQFVKDAEKDLDDDRENARLKARRWTMAGLGLALVFLGLAVAMANFYRLARNREKLLTEQKTKSDETAAILYKLTDHVALTEEKCRDTTNKEDKEVCGYIADIRKVDGKPSELQEKGARAAKAEAEAHLKQNDSDKEVLSRYRAVEFLNGDVLDHLNEGSPLNNRIASLERLVQAGSHADEIAKDPRATLAEKRDADNDYVKQAEDLRGSQGNEEVKKAKERIAGVDSQFAKYGNVVSISFCTVLDQDRHCKESTGPWTLAVGKHIAYATVRYAATRPNQPVEFRWYRDGVEVERAREFHDVSVVNPEGFRVNGQATNPQAGTWEFQVYNGQKQLVSKFPFTVK